MKSRFCDLCVPLFPDAEGKKSYGQGRDSVEGTIRRRPSAAGVRQVLSQGLAVLRARETLRSVAPAEASFFGRLANASGRPRAAGAAADNVGGGGSTNPTANKGAVPRIRRRL